MFITGLSGSGKTTEANTIKSTDPQSIEVFSIDTIYSFAGKYKHEIIEQYKNTFEPCLQNLLDEFISLTPEDFFGYRTYTNDKLTAANGILLYCKFLKFIDGKLNPTIKYIFEGFPIYMGSSQEYKQLPIIVKRTAYPKCAIRVFKRYYKQHSPHTKTIFRKRVLEMFAPWNVHFREIKTLKKFVKGLM